MSILSGPNAVNLDIVEAGRQVRASRSVVRVAPSRLKLAPMRVP